MPDCLPEHIELFKRQYLQLVPPEKLAWPARSILIAPETQAQLYKALFQPGGLPFPPPDRYRSRVLKLLVGRLEQSISDPDQDEISDDLTALLAQTFAEPAPPEMLSIQKKSYVTYSAPGLLSEATQTITTLEMPALLAADGVTGFRTWEAAKFLTSFLCSQENRHWVSGKQVIELGAGPGLLSMFCAKHLGAEFVLASDGVGEVVDSIVQNMYLNGLDDRKAMDAVVLKWGHAIMPELVLDEDGSKAYNLVLGADIIYDDRILAPLVATLVELFQRYEQIQALIAGTVRKEETVKEFVRICRSRNLTVRTVSSSSNYLEHQTGLFHSREPRIEIFEISKPISANQAI